MFSFNQSQSPKSQNADNERKPERSSDPTARGRTRRKKAVNGTISKANTQKERNSLEFLDRNQFLVDEEVPTTTTSTNNQSTEINRKRPRSSGRQVTKITPGMTLGKTDHLDQAIRNQNNGSRKTGQYSDYQSERNDSKLSLASTTTKRGKAREARTKSRHQNKMNSSLNHTRKLSIKKVNNIPKKKQESEQMICIESGTSGSDNENDGPAMSLDDEVSKKSVANKKHTSPQYDDNDDNYQKVNSESFSQESDIIAPTYMLHFSGDSRAIGSIDEESESLVNDADDADDPDDTLEMLEKCETERFIPNASRKNFGTPTDPPPPPSCDVERIDTDDEEIKSPFKRAMNKTIKAVKGFPPKFSLGKHNNKSNRQKRKQRVEQNLDDDIQDSSDDDFQRTKRLGERSRIKNNTKRKALEEDLDGMPLFSSQSDTRKSRKKSPRKTYGSRVYSKLNGGNENNSRFFENHNNRRRSTRLSSKVRTNYTEDRMTTNSMRMTDGVIAIDDSSEDEDTETNTNVVIESPTEESKRSFGERKKLDAVRIAIGAKVFSASCNVQFQPGGREQYLLIQYKKNSTDTTETKHKIGLDETRNNITEIKYYISEEDDDSGSDDKADAESKEDAIDEVMSFLAFRVSPDEDNGLAKYSNSYLSDDQHKEEKSTRELHKHYIVIEVRKSDEFKRFLGNLRDSKLLVVFMTNAGIKLPGDTRPYTQALLKDNERESKRLLERRRESKSSTSNELLLVYPFNAPESEFDAAAATLTEARGFDPTNVAEESDASQPQLPIMGRTHLLTIREEDFARLDQPEFLNDTIIDFWMRWLQRKDDPQTSNVHIFTTQFYSKLASDGPEALSSWTAKKKIDVFEKKFIFIPVNKALHWSLCVVVNPGEIENGCSFMKDRDEFDRTSDAPFILFLDSLKAHNKGVVTKNVRKWLTFEAERAGKFKSVDIKGPLFQAKSMPTLDPKIPYQDNSWDCGVFVCRYGYSVYALQDRQFTFEDLENRLEGITMSEEFRFGMADIGRMREEMKTLISKLADVYKKMQKGGCQVSAATTEKSVTKKDENAVDNKNNNDESSSGKDGVDEWSSTTKIDSKNNEKKADELIVKQEESD